MASINKKEQVIHMLWTIAVILLVLWALGFIASIGGALIHVLLVIGLVLIIVQLVTGKKV